MNVVSASDHRCSTTACIVQLTGGHTHTVHFENIFTVHVVKRTFFSQHTERTVARTNTHTHTHLSLQSCLGQGSDGRSSRVDGGAVGSSPVNAGAFWGVSQFFYRPRGKNNVFQNIFIFRVVMDELFQSHTHTCPYNHVWDRDAMDVRRLSMEEL